MTMRECIIAIKENENISRTRAEMKFSAILKNVYSEILNKSARKVGDVVSFYDNGIYTVKIIGVRVSEDNLSVSINFILSLKKTDSEVLLFEFFREFIVTDINLVRKYLDNKSLFGSENKPYVKEKIENKRGCTVAVQEVKKPLIKKPMSKKECTLALQEDENISSNMANRKMTGILRNIYKRYLLVGVKKTGDVLYFYDKGRYTLRIIKAEIAKDSLSVTIKYNLTLRKGKSRNRIVFRFGKEFTVTDKERVQKYLEAKESQKSENKKGDGATNKSPFQRKRVSHKMAQYSYKKGLRSRKPS
jgi:hypothetical protein